jgi:transposase
VTTDPSFLPVQELLDLIEQLQTRVVELESELARLKGGPPSAGPAKGVPAFVKPNKPVCGTPTERKPRKNGFSRRVETPTRSVQHAVDNCPDCGRRLSGGWVHSARQVIEIPQASYEVVEHQLLRRKCGVCAKSHLAHPDLAQDVAGKHRIGIRLMSLIVTMKKACRMTVRGIQSFLKGVYGLHLAVGTIINILKDVARRGEAFYAQLKQAIRDSQNVHADETSWRVNGKNTWMWSFSTPDVRLFVANDSRGHHVPKEVIGENFGGVLSSDFYGGYNFHPRDHQRCWAHLFRDIDALTSMHPANRKVAGWSARVKQLWRDACDFESDDPRARTKARIQFQYKLAALAQPYRSKGDDQAPQRILAERMYRYANELFTFVEYPYVPPDNNAAERAIRPIVIYRKVTGGSRSHPGVDVTAILASFIGTWNARGISPLQACAEMLRNTAAAI